MINIAYLSEATALLLKYAGEEEFCVSIQKNKICIGSDEWRVSVDDQKRLHELGFSCKEGMGWSTNS